MNKLTKVLFVDTGLGGHHQTYLNALIRASAGKAVVCAPSGGEELYDSIERYYPISAPGKSWYLYTKLIFSLIYIARQEHPDIVHFVYGDAFYRFGGLGFGLIQGKKIITCHQFLHRSKIAHIIYRRFSRIAKVIVLHTDHLVEIANSFGIFNTAHIEYPQLNLCCEIDKKTARKEIGVPEDGIPILLALGGTRYHKGLDILLEALKHVKTPFYLLVAGKPEFFQEDFIKKNSKEYRKQVILKLAFLSEKEVDCCIKACDIVCLPYRKEIDHASGPLGEGVYRGKMIVGPEHGSIGKLISDHHLGLCFEAENIESLAFVLEQALTMEWEPEEKYRDYQKQLNPQRFEAEYTRLYSAITE